MFHNSYLCCISAVIFPCLPNKHTYLHSCIFILDKAFVFIVISLTTTSAVNFLWHATDARFDCVVGISAGEQPIAIGTILTTTFVITSANPLHPYLESTGDGNEYVDKENQLKLHAVDRRPNLKKSLTIEKYYGVSRRKAAWIRMGFNETHSPIHDLVLIKINEGQIRHINKVSRREAFAVNETRKFFVDGWTFAGFGYVDIEHIKNSSLLEISSFELSDEADCDEWIPRAWGRFVCLLNVEDVVSLQSGAPLFSQGVLRGVGSFELKRGKESVLVFTDYSVYEKMLKFPSNSSEPVEEIEIQPDSIQPVEDFKIQSDSSQPEDFIMQPIG